MLPQAAVRAVRQGPLGSVALRGARVKVGGTVSTLVSDPVGVTPLVGRIVELGTDLSRRRASALCGSCA
jgi:hypothetical protein